MRGDILPIESFSASVFDEGDIVSFDARPGIKYIIWEILVDENSFKICKATLYWRCIYFLKKKARLSTLWR